MSTDIQESLQFASFADSSLLVDFPVGATSDYWSQSAQCCPVSLRDANDYGSNTETKPGLPLRTARTPGVIILAKILWAAPWSIWGVLIGTLGLLSGGGVQRSGRILEFWGGFLPFFLRTFPFIAGSPVATFGHIVVGRSQRHLEACRPHQLVHVGQYERWGPLFVPTYLGWWFVLWCCGKRPYYDNPFERQAFDQTS